MEIDEIQSLTSNKRFKLIKSNSSNNYGSSLSSFSYNNNIRREIISARPRFKSPLKIGFTRAKSPKNNMILSNEPTFLNQIKNKNVRNFYETVLKNCCREKEPKQRCLKNIFKINNNNRDSFLLKSKDKKKINRNKSLRCESTEKKSRTSNNLPFIILSQNYNLSNFNSINNDNEKTNIKISNKIKIQSILYKAAKNSSMKKQNNKIKFFPKSTNKKKSITIEKTNLFKNVLTAQEKNKEDNKMLFI